LQNVVTYDAVVDVDNPELKLKPGMTANVTFVYAEREDVLRLPSAALRFRPPPALLERIARRRQKGKKKDKHKSDDDSVWVLRDGRAARLPIDVGISDGSHVEVVTGDLREGDVVVTDASADGAGGKDKDGASSGSGRKKKSKKLF
jgi:HlyD family secretion protein